MITTSEIVDVIVIPADKFMNVYKSPEQMDQLDLALILTDSYERSSKYPFEMGADSLFVSSFRVTKSGLYT